MNYNKKNRRNEEWRLTSTDLNLFEEHRRLKHKIHNNLDGTKRVL